MAAISLFHQIFEMPSVQSNIHKKKKPLEKAYLLHTYGPMARSRVRLTRIIMKRPVPLTFKIKSFPVNHTNELIAEPAEKKMTLMVAGLPCDRVLKGSVTISSEEAEYAVSMATCMGYLLSIPASTIAGTDKDQIPRETIVTQLVPSQQLKLSWNIR
jgi:hypothetical protein